LKYYNSSLPGHLFVDHKALLRYNSNIETIELYYVDPL